MPKDDDGFEIDGGIDVLTLDPTNEPISGGDLQGVTAPAKVPSETGGDGLSWWQRLGLQAGGAAVSAVGSLFGSNPIQEAQVRLLNIQYQQALDRERAARGDFTPQERRGIQRANAPGLQALSGDLAARGIRGPAAAAQIQEQRRRPFETAQLVASQSAPAATALALQSASQLPQPPDIAASVGSFIQNISVNRQLRGQRNGGTAVRSPLEDTLAEIMQSLLTTDQGFQ